MATYFKTVNDDGITQLDDTNNVEMVCRSGQIQANYTKGEVYGFILNDDEDYVAFNLKSGILQVFPVMLYGTKRVQYVTSNGNPINYKVFSSASPNPSTHGCGMEVYNADGKVIYSTEYETMSYKEYVHIAADDSIKNGGGHASDYLKIWDNMQAGEYSGGRNSDDYWTKYTYNGTSPYIISLSMPCCVQRLRLEKKAVAFMLGYKEYSYLHTTGYSFSSGVVNTHTCTSPWLPETLLGDGDLHQLVKHTDTSGTKYDYNGHGYMYEGVFSTNYMFHIIETT